MPVTEGNIATQGQFRTKPIGTDGFFVWAWTKFFQRLETFRQNAPSYFFDLSTKRTTTDPGRVGPGSTFYETDTTHLFMSDGIHWIQIRP